MAKVLSIEGLPPILMTDEVKRHICQVDGVWLFLYRLWPVWHDVTLNSTEPFYAEFIAGFFVKVWVKEASRIECEMMKKERYTQEWWALESEAHCADQAQYFWLQWEKGEYKG